MHIKNRSCALMMACSSLSEKQLVETLVSCYNCWFANVQYCVRRSCWYSFCWLDIRHIYWQWTQEENGQLRSEARRKASMHKMLVRDWHRDRNSKRLVQDVQHTITLKRKFSWQLANSDISCLSVFCEWFLEHRANFINDYNVITEEFT